MLHEMSYEEAKKKSNALKEIGHISIYLNRESEKPWDNVTSFEESGCYRSGIYTSVTFKAKCPETDLEFMWFFYIEETSNNGKVSHKILSKECQEVTEKLSGEPLIAWRKYLKNCAEKIREKGVEFQKAADQQLMDAKILSDLSQG